MPVRFRYDKDLRMLLTTAEGLVSFDDVAAHISEESRQRALGYRELIDATRAQTSLTAEELRQIVARVLATMRTNQFGPTALVTNDDTLYGMASMFAILSDLQGGPHVGAFRSFDDALSWLVQY
jgi:hypothetical protein